MSKVSGSSQTEWKPMRLAEVADFLDGLRRPVKDADRRKMQGDVPYYGASGVVDYVNEHLFDEELILLAEDGENIVSRRTPIAYRISGRSWVNNHAHVLRARSIDPKYLCLFLESLDYEQYNTGTAQPKLNKKTCSQIEVLVPPEQEQRAIAESLEHTELLLARLDDLVGKRRDLKQATMQQLLAGKTRLPSYDGPWQTAGFGTLFVFSGGFSASREQLSSSGHCYLHYGDIHLSTKPYVDVCAEGDQIPRLDVDLREVGQASLLRDGDVVFVDASEDDEGASKHIVVENAGSLPYISGLHTIVAKSRGDHLDKLFKRYCFQSRSVKEQFKFYAVGTKVSGISKSNIAKIELTFPTSSKEQRAIATVLSDMDMEIALVAEKRDKLHALKLGMMQQLLTGRIRLI